MVIWDKKPKNAIFQEFNFVVPNVQQVHRVHVNNLVHHVENTQKVDIVEETDVLRFSQKSQFSKTDYRF